MQHVKAKDLWIPFDSSHRKPILLDRFLYIPDNIEHLAFSTSAFFEKQQPLASEFCSGNGEWIVDKAKSNPMINWIAVEKKLDRARKIWARGKNAGVDNLLTVYGDARIFLEYYLTENSLSSIYINFPDPWPKNRHAKHRLIQKDFALLLSRTLRVNGEAIFVTDDKRYSDQMIAAMLAHSFWESAYADPYFTHEWENFGSSFFLNLWQTKSCQIYYHLFLNRKGLT